MIFTLPPTFLTELFTKGEHLNFEGRIRKNIPSDVMPRLCKVPYFTAAYEPDGLAPGEFNQLPALLDTWNQFKGAMDKIVTFVSDALHTAPGEPLQLISNGTHTS